jgi:hypothetical protein
MASYTKRDGRQAEIEAFEVERRGPIARAKSKPGPPPTLIHEMRKGYGWVWFICPRCNRRTPKALAPFAIRYGFDVRVIDLRPFATCQRCGHAGALLQMPSMEGIGADMMMEPFPAELAMQGMSRWLAWRETN